MRDFTGDVRRALGQAGGTPDDDIVEELATHASTVYDAARADGCDAAEAAQHVGALIETWCTDARRLQRRSKRPPAVTAPPTSGAAWTGVLHDIRYAWRLLRRQPGFAATAIITTAIGIGAATTLFSVTYGVLMKPLPWLDPDRLVRVTESRKGFQPRVPGTISNGTFVAWADNPSTIEAIGGWLRTGMSTVVAGTGEPLGVQTMAVTPSLFRVLKARPLIGRLFADEEGTVGGSSPASDLIILSYGLWQEQFGGTEEAIGRVLQVDGKPTTIVGVMPRDFAFPDRHTRAWLPWAITGVLGERGVLRLSIFSAMARLHPGVTPAQASAEATARAKTAPDPGMAAVALFGGNGPADIRAVPAVDQMTADVRPALLVLLGAVALLLFTATANVASLQIARATTRRREIAIRAALGAGTTRLARQLIVESTILGAMGGAAGLTLAVALHRVLPSVLPADFPRADAVTMDARVLIFAAAVSIAVGVACGLLPAIHARRVNLVESLADGGSAPVGGGLRTPTVRWRAIILGAQLAVSCVLLVGAALLTQSFVALRHADRGYDATNLLTARIPLPAAYSMERRTALLDALAARLRSAAGVRDVAYGNALPLLTAGGFRGLKMRPPANPATEVEVDVLQRVVSPGYFSALGLRLSAGRVFSEADNQDSPMVIVVNRSFATKYLGPSAIGAIVPNLGMCRGDRDRWQVVGVVDDMRQGSMSDPPQSELFMPFKQVGCPASVPQPILVVRTAADPAPYVATLRTVLHDLQPSLALDSVMTMEDRVMATLAKPRLYAVVIDVFGIFAMAVAGVGLFGVLSYSVAQRSREIGVRTALGARPIDIVSLVLRQVAVIAGGGIAVGLWLAFTVSRSLNAVLFGVSHHDAGTFVAAALVLAIVAAAACVGPACRAARIDPLEALRQ